MGENTSIHPLERQPLPTATMSSTAPAASPSAVSCRATLLSQPKPVRPLCESCLGRCVHHDSVCNHGCGRSSSCLCRVLKLLPGMVSSPIPRLAQVLASRSQVHDANAALLTNWTGRKPEDWAESMAGHMRGHRPSKVLGPKRGQPRRGTRRDPCRKPGTVFGICPGHRSRSGHCGHKVATWSSPALRHYGHFQTCF
jgi:hypothetical protein